MTPETLICERPAEVEDRAVPGHWEGDQEPHCADEAIEWTGSMDIVFVTTQTPNGATQSVNTSMQLEGTGLESGEHYTLNTHSHEISRGSDRGADVYVFSVTYPQISSGGDSNYLYTSVGVLVSNAENVQIVNMDRAHLGCVG